MINRAIRRTAILTCATGVLSLGLIIPAGASTGLRPSEPRSVHAVAASSSAVVQWTRPARGHVTSYTVSSSPGSAGCVSRRLTCSVKDLTNSVEYRFRVRASSPSGVGAWSAWSFGVTPSGPAANYGQGPLPPDNPSNLLPDPYYETPTACNFPVPGVFTLFTVTAACTAEILAAINNAHAAENVEPMVLPTNWNSLSVPEQLFVLVDLERVDRELPPYLGINAALSANAQAAAVAGQDPSQAAGFADALSPYADYDAVGGAWSNGYSPLDAEYWEMYSDGWGGSTANTSNPDCTSAVAAACWGHRDELLGYDPAFNAGVGLTCTTCEMGVGYSLLNASGSYTDLVELPAGAPPVMTFTWAEDVVPYLPTQ